MATSLKIVVFYRSGFKAGKIANHFRQINGLSGYDLIDGYSSPADLVAKIKALSAANAHACVDYLLIYAHGNPTVLNAIRLASITAWATELKKVPWCDSADLYLNGCNTGLKTALGNGPIAKLLADAIPFNATSFAHQISVYGTTGYHRGSHAKGNNSVSKTLTKRIWSLKWWYIIPYPSYKDVVTHTAYPGSTDATGAACYNRFKNGSW